MLIEFSVSNYRSIKDRIALSMVAGKYSEHSKTHVIENLPSGLSLLKSVAMYGPNAAGKSNILSAFKFMRKFVLSSFRNVSKGAIPVDPHLFDIKTKDAPTEVEVIIMLDGVRYQYGFIVDKTRVLNEWLFAYPKGRIQVMFTREYDNDTNSYNVKIGQRIKGSKSTWIKTTREDSLLLSTAVTMNSRDFMPVFEWFVKTRVITPDSNFSSSTIDKCKDPAFKKRIVAALIASDTNIKDIVVRKQKLDFSEFMTNLIPESLRKDFSEKEFDAVYARHSVIGGGFVDLSMKEESEGTNKLFSLIGPWIDVLDSGYTVFVDEMSDRLHPMLLRFLIEKFHNPELNRKGAQIIFTSHDTSIMRPEYLRRDQIWFAVKNDENATDLYPLTDFHPRKGIENFERNYLSGQYGALPYLRDVASVMGADDGN